MASLSIILAVAGMCSLICTPEALVAICLNWPPVGAPGFKSQISIVLGPPPIHIMMAPLPDFFSSAALAHMVSANDSAVPAMALAPAKCFIKCRRDMPEGVAKLIGSSSFVIQLTWEGWSAAYGKAKRRQSVGCLTSCGAR